jgi:hypothetical protein
MVPLSAQGLRHVDHLVPGGRGLGHPVGAVPEELGVGGEGRAHSGRLQVALSTGAGEPPGGHLPGELCSGQGRIQPASASSAVQITSMPIRSMSGSRAASRRTSCSRCWSASAGSGLERDAVGPVGGLRAAGRLGEGPGRLVEDVPVEHRRHPARPRSRRSAAGRGGRGALCEFRIADCGLRIFRARCVGGRVYRRGQAPRSDHLDTLSNWQGRIKPRARSRMSMARSTGWQAVLAGTAGGPGAAGGRQGIRSCRPRSGASGSLWRRPFDPEPRSRRTR